MISGASARTVLHELLLLKRQMTTSMVLDCVVNMNIFICSPSLIPADSEWSFVVNFETVAIRFSCNSRAAMNEWVECIRHKLGEMGILNPKGNLYSKVD